MGGLYALIILLAVLVSGAVGIVIGWHLHEPVAVPEDVAPAAGVVQADNSVITPRVAPPAKPGKPPHQLPKGAKEERRIAVTVQPKAEDCPPLSLDLSLVQVDGGRRVVASSPDGEVIASQDTPLEAAFVPAKPRLWAAGASADLRREKYGAWLDRDIGRLRIGAELVEEQGELSPLIRLGWTF